MDSVNFNCRPFMLLYFDKFRSLIEQCQDIKNFTWDIFSAESPRQKPHQQCRLARWFRPDYADSQVDCIRWLWATTIAEDGVWYWFANRGKWKGKRRFSLQSTVVACYWVSSPVAKGVNYCDHTYLCDDNHLFAFAPFDESLSLLNCGWAINTVKQCETHVSA